MFRVDKGNLATIKRFECFFRALALRSDEVLALCQPEQTFFPLSDQLEHTNSNQRTDYVSPSNCFCLQMRPTPTRTFPRMCHLEER